jgi:cell division protein FtsZ
MEKFTITVSNTLQIPRIVAVGISGSGSNIIDYMLNNNSSCIELINANMNDQDGYKDLHKTLEGADVVFVVVGLGGITGTYIAPIIAKIAKAVGALTIGVVSKPFCFEGPKRLEIAGEGFEILKKVADSIVVIPNDKLLPNINTKLGIKECFKSVDSVFARIINGIATVIIPRAENDINLDFKDLQTIMSHRGASVVGIGEHQGDNAAHEAINNALIFAMVNSDYIQNASAVLVHFTIHSKFDFIKLSDAMEIVQQGIDGSTDIIFGTTTDESLPIDFIRVTVIATGAKELI